jgi:geranyl-CoA carboxylase alpha subunit
MADFRKVLVANRGEIALRVMRTAKAMGYQTVAVYSDADADAPHVLFADEAVHIGPATVSQSYLKIDVIIAACQKTGADAVHPGYGFLSENTDFCAACQANGITFIGPDPKAIEMMGNKRLAKIEMLNANVPCIPGYEGQDQNPELLEREAARIGYPVMIKAAAGGGGRGMRLVHSATQFAEQLKTAKSEAKNAFGSDEVILEKAVIEPRHIEIQVFADRHGNCVYLGERDCSVQRRHQKVVEEAPSPFVDPALRQRMGEAAVNVARACDYVGAGTVEFLVDKNKNFYFLEMNTRLQVEHPVTELVTGVDLVAWQLSVAAGEPLPLTQDKISIKGHAMEVRLYAEDPAQNFMPQTGPVLRWLYANRDGLRMDAGIREGQSITPFYDPMLAKVIAYGENRHQARRRLMGSLRDLCLLGVKSNRGFLHNLIAHPVFAAGGATTAFIEKDFAGDESLHVQPVNSLQLALSAWLLYLNSASRNDSQQARVYWRNSNPSPVWYQLAIEGQKYRVGVMAERNGEFALHTPEGEIRLQLITNAQGELIYLHEGVRRKQTYAVVDGVYLYLNTHAGSLSIEDITHQPAQAEGSAGSGLVKASMDGAIIDVLVENGAKVTAGQTLVVLEAMKMEHSLKAQIDGTVQNILVQKGDQVKNRQLLVEVIPAQAIAEPA